MRQGIKRLRSLKNRQDGFTVLELVAVIVLIGVLLALVFAAYSGVQRNQRNQERQADVQEIYQELEAYYVVNSKYPTLVEINNTNWRTTNMKTLNQQSLRDPSSSLYTLVGTPTADAYSYDVVAANGGPCNNQKQICAHYTLTATLEDSSQKTFVKSSLN